MNTIEFWMWLIDMQFIILALVFLAKSLGKMFFFALLAAAVALGAVYYFNIAPEFLAQIKDFFGLHDANMLGDVPTIFLAWARLHVVACVGALIGFVVGYSIG